MAFDVTELSAYIEDQDFPLVAQMQATGSIAEWANIQTGLKGSSNLQFLSTDVVFASDSCSRTPADTTAFTQRTITVGTIQISENLCTKDLNGFWTQTKVRQGVSGETEIPQPIEGVWMDKKINAIQNQLAISDWQGDTASGTNNLSYYDGALKIIDADVTTIDGNPTGITVATGIDETNIISILQGMWKLLPDNMKAMTNVNFNLGWDLYSCYINALINANLFHFKGEDGNTTLHGTNVGIRPQTGLTGTDRIVLTNDDNVTIGMDGENEEDNLEVWYSQDDRINKFNTAFKRGYQHAFGNQIVEFTLVP